MPQTKAEAKKKLATRKAAAKKKAKKKAAKKARAKGEAGVKARAMGLDRPVDIFAGEGSTAGKLKEHRVKVRRSIY